MFANFIFMNTFFRISSVLILIFSSCAITQKKIVNAYDASTSAYELKYISLRIGIGFENSAGPHIDSIVGYAVLPFGKLSGILNNDKDRCFSDIVFRKLCRNDVLLVDEQEYKKLFPYLISVNDGDKWKKYNTSRLLKKHSNDNFLIGKFFIEPNEQLPYYYRCIMNNFVHNGICVSYNDEDGGWMWTKY